MPQEPDDSVVRNVRRFGKAPGALTGYRLAVRLPTLGVILARGLGRFLATACLCLDEAALTPLLAMLR